MEGNNDDQANEEERRRRWREIYGDMVPERIVDTKIGEDGKRYYKVQWAVSNFEPAKNFLEAELLVRKYWDPVEKKLKLPSNKKKKEKDEKRESGSSSNEESSASSSTSQPAPLLSPPKPRSYDKSSEEKDTDESSACINNGMENKKDGNKDEKDEITGQKVQLPNSSCLPLDIKSKEGFRTRMDVTSCENDNVELNSENSKLDETKTIESTEKTQKQMNEISSFSSRHGRETWETKPDDEPAPKKIKES